MKIKKTLLASLLVLATFLSLPNAALANGNGKNNVNNTNKSAKKTNNYIELYYESKDSTKDNSMSLSATVDGAEVTFKIVKRGTTTVSEPEQHNVHNDCALFVEDAFQSPRQDNVWFRDGLRFTISKEKDYWGFYSVSIKALWNDPETEFINVMFRDKINNEKIVAVIGVLDHPQVNRHTVIDATAQIAKVSSAAYNVNVSIDSWFSVEAVAIDPNVGWDFVDFASKWNGIERDRQYACNRKDKAVKVTFDTSEKFDTFSMLVKVDVGDDAHAWFVSVYSGGQFSDFHFLGITKW